MSKYNPFFMQITKSLYQKHNKIIKQLTLTLLSFGAINSFIITPVTCIGPSMEPTLDTRY